MALSLSGCDLNTDGPPVVLYVAVAVNSEDAISSETHRRFNERLNVVVEDFQRLHPSIHVQIALYPEHNLLQELKRRDDADLGPDLLLTNLRMSKQLLEEGLTDPIPKTQKLPSQILPDILSEVSMPGGVIAAEPLVLHPQLACFNRDMIATPPRTMRDLLAISAAGIPVGLTTKVEELLWTAGSLNALDALAEARSGISLNATERQALMGWLRWLQQANTMQRLTFDSNQTVLREGLQRGEYAWISCSSMDIQPLKKSMGRRLGVSPLPNGRHHVASPINQIRVLALGRDSSARQRKASLRFLNYIAQPQVQRDLSLRSFSFLPVNPFVTVPVESSSILRSMVTAREQAADSQPSLSIISSYGEASRSIQTLLVHLIFGVSTPEETADALINALQQEVQP